MKEYFEYFLYWYLCGGAFCIAFLIFHSIFLKEEVEIKLEDIVQAMVVSLAGPLLWFAIIAKLLLSIHDIYSKHRNIVIWRNKRARNKHILFGDPDEHN